MSKTEENTDQKAAMKALRQERKAWIKAAAAKVKEHNSALGAIREQLKDTPRTVPEIAEGTGLSTSKVMWYVASMKKFGEILEADQDDSYFRYQLAGGEKEK
jgi:predicted Rossmann fold nucleotide-binding protein DprA/Smf involved in DNA uptake